MSFSLTIPAVTAEHFDQAAELVLQRAARQLAPVGATQTATIAVECAKELVRVWDVAQVPGRTIGALVKGDVNPGGDALPGFPNDSIEIKLWRST